MHKMGWDHNKRVRRDYKLLYRQSTRAQLFSYLCRSWLFKLTLATSNLYSGLILAFQRHWFWPYRPVRVVFVVSPRAVIECGCRCTVDGVQLIQWFLRWGNCLTLHLVLIEWCFRVIRDLQVQNCNSDPVLYFRKKVNDNPLPRSINSSINTSINSPSMAGNPGRDF